MLAVVVAPNARSVVFCAGDRVVVRERCEVPGGSSDKVGDDGNSSEYARIRSVVPHRNTEAWLRYSNLVHEADADSECSTLLSPPPSRGDPLNTSASSAAQSDFDESARTGSRHTEEHTDARRWTPSRISTAQLSDMRNAAAAATEVIGATGSAANSEEGMEESDS